MCVVINNNLKLTIHVTVLFSLLLLLLISFVLFISWCKRVNHLINCIIPSDRKGKNLSLNIGFPFTRTFAQLSMCYNKQLIACLYSHLIRTTIMTEMIAITSYKNPRKKYWNIIYTNMSTISHKNIYYKISNSYKNNELPGLTATWAHIPAFDYFHTCLIDTDTHQNRWWPKILLPFPSFQQMQLLFASFIVMPIWMESECVYVIHMPLCFWFLHILTSFH